MYYKIINITALGTKNVSFVAGSDYKPGWRKSVFKSGRILTLPATKWEMQSSIRERLNQCYTPIIRGREKWIDGAHITEYYPNRHLRKRGYAAVYAVIDKKEAEG